MKCEVAESSACIFNARLLRTQDSSGIPTGLVPYYLARILESFPLPNHTVLCCNHSYSARSIVLLKH